MLSAYVHIDTVKQLRNYQMHYPNNVNIDTVTYPNNVTFALNEHRLGLWFVCQYQAVILPCTKSVTSINK